MTLLCKQSAGKSNYWFCRSLLQNEAVNVSQQVDAACFALVKRVLRGREGAKSLKNTVREDALTPRSFVVGKALKI